MGISYLGFVFFAGLPLCLGSLHSIFNHFEVLQPYHISVKQKRSADGQSLTGTVVSFSAFQKNFTMLLNPGSRVLHPDARVDLVDGDGTATPFRFQRDKFYTGHLNGSPTFEVDASEINGVWMAHIHTPDEFYALEPLKFYDSQAEYTSMIVYRETDIRGDNDTENKPFCKEVIFQEPSDGQNRGQEQFSNHRNPKKFQSIFSDMRWPLEVITINRTGWGRWAHSNSLLHQLQSSKVGSSTHEEHKPEQFEDRTKRSSRKQKDYARKATECDVLAVADYNIYKGAGARNPASVLQTIVSVYNIIDRIFRSSDFGSGESKGSGITLGGIIIHTNFSKSSPHYNNMDLKMNASDLLRLMTKTYRFHDYCVAHMTTQRTMGITLGLAAVAKPLKYWMNGICASLNRTVATNVGLSTIYDIKGKILPLKRYSLVLAHEIGHNWGANHDSVKSQKCSPTTAQGGKFIMWPYIGLGKDPNSERFSPCSKFDINRVLNLRAHGCFLNKNLAKRTCGNGIVDEDEDCDSGYVDLQGADQCCDINCRFKPGAVCSFKNHPCCTKQCTIAGRSKQCYPKGGLQPCYKPSFCPGNSSTRCPPPSNVPNDTPCGNGGRCWYGRCKSFCERTGLSESPPRDLRPCECDSDRVSMCKMCCWDRGNIDGKCKIVGGTMENGTMCVLGICNGGVCEENKDAKGTDSIFLLASKSHPDEDSALTLDISLSLLLFGLASSVFQFFHWV